MGARILSPHIRSLAAALCLLALGTAARAQTPGPDAAAFRQDALGVEAMIDAQYAYLERFPGGAAPTSDVLRAEAEAVHDRSSLLHYAERAVAALADHHAITGSSFDDSWALVPSYSDLWIEPVGDDWMITAVRDGSPAMTAGVRAGDRLTAVGEVPTGDAVNAFWADLGLTSDGDDRPGYAARVLAAGRRDRARDLTIRTGDGPARRLSLPSLYAAHRSGIPLIVSQSDGALLIRFNDSLGEDETVAAFDAAMATARPGQPVVLDLTDTASGGNTVVARAVMGWFVDQASPYQIHNLPAEERETGVPRQWIEEVLPRPGKHHDGPVTVRVGRWTGSMGEGLAVGLDALGARVVGGPMAGLRGAVYDQPLPNSGLVIKLPTERVYSVDGRPREQFAPLPR